MITRVFRALVALTLATSIVLGMSAPAFAHDPIFITADQTTPDTGPFMPDGSISWALYGSVLSDGDTRGFEFDLREGDEVFVSLLIPNLSPEVDLADGELPIIELEAPDGTMKVISPEIREVFDEAFSRTSYVTLAEYREPGQAGRYRGVIVGNAAARFSVAIGETEIFFTETERSGDRPSNFAEITGPLTVWYTTPAGGEPSTAVLADGEAEIDLDLIDEAMASGEAQAPEGSNDVAADDVSDVDDASTDEAVEVAEDQETEGSNANEADTSATESASAPLADDGSSSTWVAPVVVAAIALLGGGAFLARRNSNQ